MVETAAYSGVWVEVGRLLLGTDYNTRVVLMGSAMLGLAAGLVGVYMLLRKRALFGDAISHATLPGIAGAFLVMQALGYHGKYLPGLLAGAALTGTLGMLAVLGIRDHTRLKEDAALGIVLSVFFGFGVTLLGIVQGMRTGSAAGLESFIYGKTASMLAADAWLLSGAAGLTTLLCVVFFKEFKLLCFDADFARVNGWPARGLDVLLMSLVVLIVTAGLQAVGLILVLALLMTPPAAARFWTDRLDVMLVLSATLGAVGCLIGAGASAVMARLPAGAAIVMAQAGLFAVSLLLGTRRGLLPRWWHQRRLRQNMTMEHLLRTVFEASEQGEETVSIETLRLRLGGAGRSEDVLRRAQRSGWITRYSDRISLNAKGLIKARQQTRNHRLWELFLMHYAEMAASHVDRHADEIEHVLDPEMIERLTALLPEAAADTLPPSPHPLGNKEPAR